MISASFILNMKSMNDYTYKLRLDKRDEKTIKDLSKSMGMSINKMIRFALLNLIIKKKHDAELVDGCQCAYMDTQTFSRLRFIEDSAEGFGYVADEMNDDYHMMLGEMLNQLSQDLTDIDDIRGIRIGLFYDIAWGDKKDA